MKRLRAGIQIIIKVTVARNKKLTLKPVISPITSQEKVTYSSSNKKIATVSSSGVITGKKKGTAYITDIGMTGPVKSVIGMDIVASIK